MILIAFNTLLLVFCSSSASVEQVKVNCGDDVLLQSHAPPEAVIRLLEWIRPDLKSDGDVFFYRNDRSYENYQHPSFHGRVELKDPEMKDGDVSVVLKNVTVNDTGTYECRIISSATTIGGERSSSELRLTVKLEVSGHMAGNTWDREKTDKITNDGEKRSVIIGVAVLSAVVFLVVGFLILRKKHLNNPLYKLHAQSESEQQLA